jgi:hypothetical protein
LEEALLLAAHQRQQKIEFMKIESIYTANIAPEKAYEVITRLQRLMFPEIEDQLQEREALQSTVLEEEQGFVWVLEGDRNGYYGGKRVKAEDAEKYAPGWTLDRGA